MDTQTAKQRAMNGVAAARDELVEISLDIHQHPELAMKEERAAELLGDRLEGQGFAVERGAFNIPTAFRARWGEGPVTIAYLCEYDALPEIGHACGHNLIATVGMGGALGLKAAVSPDQVTLLVLGTPAEEDIGGKVMMIERGAFDGVDVAMMAHPSPFDIADPPMYGVEQCHVVYRGQAAHASVAPEVGVNALDGLVLAYQAIAQLRQHMRRDARIHGIITYGGSAANVSPDRVTLLVLGTPAEEDIGGKVMMIERGAFDGVDVAMMAHPSPFDIADPPMYGVEQCHVVYRGQAAHASVAPEVGVNALDGLVLAYQAMAQLRQHMRRDARVHGIITYGGSAANVVPDRAEGTFLVRALQPAYLAELKSKVIKCFEAGAEASGASVSIVWAPYPYMPMNSNMPVANAYRANAEAAGREFLDQKVESTGSTDMGNVSWVVPSIHPTFGLGAFAINHTEGFTKVSATDAAHESMVQVAQALAMTGVDLVLNPDLLREAKAAFGE